MASKTKNLLGNLTRERESEPVKPFETAIIATEVIQEVSKANPLQKKTDNGKDYKVHSFCIDWEDFAYLNDFVDHMRMSGNTKFTQKDALNTAIGLLIRKYPRKELLKRI